MRAFPAVLALALAVSCGGHAATRRAVTPAPTPSTISTAIVKAKGHGWSGALYGPATRPVACTMRTAGDGSLPDPGCTPGSIDGAVTQANLDKTICSRGYTATVRPPSWVTAGPKRVSMKQYGKTGTGEYDHLIPLELGGSSDLRNLWFEPGPLPNAKDQVENALNRLVCARTITLAVAQQLIATDWTTALAKAATPAA